MWKRRGIGTLAAVLLLGACSKGAQVGSSSDPEQAWMDQAQVVVTEDLCGGQETVELVDVASGHSEVVSDESFAPDPGACGQPAAVAQTLAVSAPLSK